MFCTALAPGTVCLVVLLSHKGSKDRINEVILTLSLSHEVREIPRVPVCSVPDFIRLFKCCLGRKDKS